MTGPVVAFIFARGGSKGVPRKNIRSFAGKPLIAHAIEAARTSRLVDRVVVSTEDEEIAEISHRYGAEVPFMRPPELAVDKAPELLAWKHAITQIQAQGGIGTFVSVPATSPLRIVEDIDNCIRKVAEPETDLVLSITASSRHPMYNMVVLNKEGIVQIANPPTHSMYQRQEAPAIFEVVGTAYAARPEFIAGTDSLLGGRTRAVVVPVERTIDIDSELDFVVAEFLFLRQGTGSREG